MDTGVVMGALIVPVLFTQLPRFLPDIPGHPGLILSLDGVAIGALLIATLWFRPQGIIPERPRKPKAAWLPAGPHRNVTDDEQKAATR